MTSLSADVVTYFQQLPWLELIAMLLSLAYVILAAKGSIWCWPSAFISTILYTYIFFDVMLLMDSALNAYYLIMAVYGYWQWSHSKDNSNTTQLAITSWALRVHVKACVTLTFVSLALAYIVDNYTPAHFAYLDTFTTVFAVFATYLVTQKVLENWLYWVVIDFASIYLYIEKGLIPTTVLFVIFVVIAVYGYRSWSKLYRASVQKEQVTPEH